MESCSTGRLSQAVHIRSSAVIGGRAYLPLSIVKSCALSLVSLVKADLSFMNDNFNFVYVLIFASVSHMSVYRPRNLLITCFLFDFVLPLKTSLPSNWSILPLLEATCTALLQNQITALL